MTPDPQFHGRHAAACHVEQFKRHHPDRPLPTPPTRHALVVVAS